MIPETMKAVLYYGPKEIRLENVPIPQPGPGEVLLKVGAALTCGTDFKAYRQGHRVLLGDLPSPFGHELAGVVAAAGDGVSLAAGTRVVAANSAPCAGCFFCERGQTQLCERLKLHNGAYAEYNLVPAHIVSRNVYPIGDALPFEVAALAEPLACAVHGVDVLQVQPEDSVAVIGAGIMSMLLIEVLKARGARVCVVGRGPDGLARAREAGAHQTVSVESGDPVGQARSFGGGRGCDHVIEAVGKADTWQLAVEMVRPGGKVCLFGGCAQGTRVSLDAHRIHYSQISLFGVFHHTPKYFAAAIELLKSGKIDHSRLITGSIPLDAVPGYFRRMHERSNPKVAVLP
jgi:L-iditol 2-dehydrogenase